MPLLGVLIALYFLILKYQYTVYVIDTSLTWVAAQSSPAKSNQQKVINSMDMPLLDSSFAYFFNVPKVVKLYVDLKMKKLKLEVAI